ncbi:hypothetical protein KM043_002696 [Ampulex compressa]|nr:hypothetical protein KM043_002696 [Ampulex compressa]
MQTVSRGAGLSRYAAASCLSQTSFFLRPSCCAHRDTRSSALGDEWGRILSNKEEENRGKGPPGTYAPVIRHGDKRDFRAFAQRREPAVVSRARTGYLARYRVGFSIGKGIFLVIKSAGPFLVGGEQDFPALNRKVRATYLRPSRERAREESLTGFRGIYDALDKLGQFS